MNRRLVVAAAATAAVGLAAGGVATTAGAAVPKNEIRIVGGFQFKAGEYLKINFRFKPRDVTVKSGATVHVDNRTKEEPHTISFVERKWLPKGFDTPVLGPLGAAHAFDEQTGNVGFKRVNDGVGVPNDQPGLLEVNTLGNDKAAGDSEYIEPGEDIDFKVTAKKGSRLFYFCAVHPWMQGKIKVN